jgi:transcription termination/antitermination protein NusG
MLWYTVRTYPGCEGKLRKYLLQQVRESGLHDRLGEVLIPIVPFFQWTWQGKRISRQKAFPGYLFLKLDPRARAVIRRLLTRAPVAAGFLGRRPVPQEEIDKILALVTAKAPPEPQLSSFQEGALVRVIVGPFASFTGPVEAILPEKNKLRVQIEIFGRKVPIELELSQIEKA